MTTTSRCAALVPVLCLTLLAHPARAEITRPLPNEEFGAYVRFVEFAWDPLEDAATYTFKLLLNGTVIEVEKDLAGTALTLTNAYSPGYYTALVRGENGEDAGPWSQPVTFLVRRKMKPEGVYGNLPARFTWTRSKGVDGYKLTLFKQDARNRIYIMKRDTWVPQPASGDPAWLASYAFKPGVKYRWTITDYRAGKPGYTSSSYFSEFHMEGSPVFVGLTVIAQGNGGSTYSGSLLPGVVPGTLQILAAGMEITDNGAGKLMTIGGQVGTIQYYKGGWRMDLKGHIVPLGLNILARYSVCRKLEEDSNGTPVQIGSVPIAVGNGGSIYRGELLPNVVPGTLQITAGAVVFTDDGNGALVASTGLPSQSGSIHYASGAWSLNLAGIMVPAGQGITARYSVYQ